MKKKIKLRDLTKEQWDDWLRINCCVECSNCPAKGGSCAESDDESVWINNKEIFNDKFLDKEIEIEVPDILDKKEKEYLSAVIKPFRDKIRFIAKQEELYYNAESIHITINVEIGDKQTIQTITLPYFLKNSAYKRMKLNKIYTLKELGL